VRPPSRDLKDFGDPKFKEQMIKSLREHRRVRSDIKLPDYVPRGSELYRKAMKDTRSGNFKSLESGLTDTQAKSIIQHGPTSHGAGLPHPGNMPDLAKGKRARHHALYKLEDLPSSGPRDWDGIERRIFQDNMGLFANSAGTDRTRDYARRAASHTNDQPYALRFDLPKSLAGPSGGQEYRVPRDVMRRWAKNVRAEPVGGSGPVIKQKSLGEKLKDTEKVSSLLRRAFITELEKIASKKVVNFLTQIPYSRRAPIVSRGETVAQNVDELATLKKQHSFLSEVVKQKTPILHEDQVKRLKEMGQRIKELSGPADLSGALPFRRK
jgi:hypothetical protein